MTQALIVGAGPIGIMLGIELLRRGIAVRLVDAASGPFAGSRGRGRATAHAGNLRSHWRCRCGVGFEQALSPLQAPCRPAPFAVVLDWYQPRSNGRPALWPGTFALRSQRIRKSSAAVDSAMLREGRIAEPVDRSKDRLRTAQKGYAGRPTFCICSTLPNPGILGLRKHLSPEKGIEPTPYLAISGLLRAFGKTRTN